MSWCFRLLGLMIVGWGILHSPGYAQAPRYPMRVATQAIRQPPEPIPPAEPLPQPPPAQTPRPPQRLPLLPLHGTPRVTPEVQQKFDRFVERTIEPENVLDLVVGRPRLLVFRQPPFRVQIGRGQTADLQQGQASGSNQVLEYVLITERELSLTGLQTGTTVLNLWFRDPQNPNQQQILSYLVNITRDPAERERLEAIYDALEAEINRNFPNSVVRLSLVGDSLLLEGQAKDIEEATQILRIVGRNAPGGPETIPIESLNVNLLSVPGVDNQPPQEGTLENFLLQQEETQTSRVINRLRIPGVHQVMLKVTVAEVNRSATRSIGATFAIGDPSNPVSFLSSFLDDGIDSLSDVIANAEGGRFFINAGDFRLALQALKELGYARTLSEPNLVALNGRSASLQVGGSFPIPAQSATNVVATQGVQFVPFGVLLNFVPVILEDRIRLQINAEVSTVDTTLGTNIGGFGAGGGGIGGGGAGSAGGFGTFVPGIQTQNFSSIVELQSGQTLAIGGLLSNNLAADSSRVPFLGDVPYLGRLFKSDTTNYDEQELIFMVTPILVEPLDHHERLPLPGSDIFEPDDCEFFLEGRIESRFAEDYRSPVRQTIEQMREFRRCERQFIIGPTGHSDGKY